MKAVMQLLTVLSPDGLLVTFHTRSPVRLSKSGSGGPAKQERSIPLRPDPARSLQFARLTRWLRFTVAAAVTAFSAQQVSARVAPSALLERGKTVEQHLAGGESHEYKFPLQVGQYAKVSIEQRTIDVAIACFGPDGKQLFVADNEKIGDTETAELISNVSGTYGLQVTVPDRHALDGRYAITLENVDLATKPHQARVAAARAFEKGMSLFEQGKRDAMFSAVGYFQDAIAH